MLLLEIQRPEKIDKTKSTITFIAKSTFCELFTFELTMIHI